MSHMKRGQQPWMQWSLISLVLASFLTVSQGLAITYCSPANNAPGGPVSSNYMSNGLCQTTCQGSFVFAVLQGKNCYCSNDAPATTEDTWLCNEACPGFPSDTCGSTDRGLYAYFNLGGNALATADGPSSSSTAAPTPPPSSVEPSSSSLSSSTVSEIASSDTPPSPPSPSPSTSSTTEQPTQVYTSIISVTGRVSTVIVTPSSSATSAQSTDSALGASASPNSNGGGGLKGGTVAGIVVGVAILIGLIIGGIVFFWLRRRHRRDLDAASEGASFASPSHASKNNGGIPSRQVSQMSSAGLLTRPARSNTGGLPPSDDHRSGVAGTMSSDRASTHMTVDQRLNPWAIYSNEDSRASNVSLQDNQDYSRQLRVANPDP